MNKLLIAVCVAIAVAGAGAWTPPGQNPGTQSAGPKAPAPQSPPQTQPPQTPPKVAVPPVAQTAAPPKPTGQTSPPSAPQAAKPATPAGSQTAARATAKLFVTTMAGAPIADAKVTLAGPVEREGVTSREGSVRFTSLRSGTYRVRFDAPDFILFEKELALRAGQALETEVTLNAAPVKKVEAQPPSPPPPAPKPIEAPAEPAGDMSALSLPDWIERNLIGRSEPQKLSPIGQTAGAAVAILQVRETVADRVHPDADEMLYVIAGEGSARIGDRTQTLSAGWFVVVPRDTPYALERRGRNPLILLSIVAPARGTGAAPR
ncbi:MAG: cupin domain-containing protein [Acidobacteria bacterium]|nr:cupin domain-containing protein [Acidobacteriota bacterium]